MIPTHDDADDDTSYGYYSYEDPDAESDSVFDLLADPRRRIVLQYLTATDGAATIEELAEEIAHRETGPERYAISDHGDVQSSALGRIRIALHHVHVPKLAAADAVAFDGSDKTVALCERGEQLLARMDAIRADPQQR